MDKREMKKRVLFYALLNYSLPVLEERMGSMAKYQIALEVFDKDVTFVSGASWNRFNDLLQEMVDNAESKIEMAWDLNISSLFNVLNLAKEKIVKKIFWPSSIAVFGPNTIKDNTPQFAITEPNTVYGISKLAGERWCEYYYNKFQVDVVSLRYPGLIGWKSQPGGGTTDYAVDIFHEAIKNKSYNCFLEKNTFLPMMYMQDAINATLKVMNADANKVQIRSSYNISGISFSPEDISNEIKKHITNFSISYSADFRQKIADSWPNSIDDSIAKKDWGWETQYDLSKMTSEMIHNLKAI